MYSGGENIMEQRRQLRVLIVGRQDNFQRILVTNIQCWGYEAVVLPSASLLRDDETLDISGDVLLYDLDEPFRKMTGNGSSSLRYGLLTNDLISRYSKQWPRTLFTIVLSSRSVSRVMLEQIGAIALLLKPFEMGRLQRYLRVLQRLVLSDADMLPSQYQSSTRQTHDEKLRVLVVDDDIDVAHAIRQCLVYEPGYEVAVAHDGLEALEQCLDWHPQCVVTDLIMPWMNGYQVMRCLSAGSLPTMPAFVVMSALTQLESPVNRSYLDGKAVAYVDKPFHIDHLLTAIKQVCPE